MTKNKKQNKNQVLIDVGSTLIKYFRLDSRGNISDAGYFARDYDRLVGNQTIAILQNEIGYNDSCDLVRICSSANGGLKVGILGYTVQFSARWAARAAANSGANIAFVADGENFTRSLLVPVDILVIVGGVEHSPVSRQLDWLQAIKSLSIECDAIIFAGNELLAEPVKRYWPEALIIDNVLGEDMRWQGQPLVNILRQAYLKDLVHSKGIAGLQGFSEVPILPTPAIVQESYGAILSGISHISVLSPLILLDVGGATTDVFYGSELIIDSEGCHSYLSINRHVFTHLGVSVSRESLLEELSLHERLGDFLRALDFKESERQYLALKEGVTDWVTPRFLAEACCFLALDRCLTGLPDGHKLALDRVASILVTGGASQLCDSESLGRIFRLCGADHAACRLDHDYRTWIEGMIRLTP
jgi:hypothetical protein